MHYVLQLFSTIKTKFLIGLRGCSDGKKSACNAEELNSVPELGRSPREGNGYALQYACLENSMDRGDWLHSMGSQRVRHDWASHTQRQSNVTVTEDGITDLRPMGSGGLRELVMDREAWRAVVHGVAKRGTRLSDWTELNWTDDGRRGPHSSKKRVF